MFWTTPHNFKSVCRTFADSKGGGGSIAAAMFSRLTRSFKGKFKGAVYVGVRTWVLLSVKSLKKRQNGHHQPQFH